MTTESTTYTIDLGDLGEIEVEVKYAYSPPERAVIHGPPESWYPGCPAELEILSVTPDWDGRIEKFLADDEVFFEHVVDLHDPSQNYDEDAANERYRMAA